MNRTAMGRDENPDNLLQLMTKPLTDEQRLYIDRHKHLKRSKLAKTSGVPKLQLNHYMGGNDAS